MTRLAELGRDAIRHLQRFDPLMHRVARRVGPFALKLEPDRFSMLVRSIIGQQISVAAARSVFRRLKEVTAPHPLSPHGIARLPEPTLRSAGLSAQKARYLYDLARKVDQGAVRLRRIGRLSDEAVIKELIQVKGIGRWTAQMFLIFSLGRPDVFPEEDLALRTALQQIYGLKASPDSAVSRRIAAPWRPYATVACWYCWRAIDGGIVARP